MAKPRILVSSTCKDLYIIREQLRILIDNMGYEPILSEDGDVYYSPDLHVHLSCIREIYNCDMVVLIVGNKFGSEFISDRYKSITQMEHNTAHISNLPIFAFIDEHVLHDYSIYSKIIEKTTVDPKRQQALISEIPFASQCDTRIFKFIDDIKKKITNNAYFPFKNFYDIETLLKKQWSGMVFDFLKQRRESSENQKVYNLLSQIEVASVKVEQIVGLLATNILKPHNKESLKKIEYEANEKRLDIALFQFWQSFDLNSAYLDNARNLSDKDINDLRKLLLSSNLSNDENIDKFMHKLQKAGILKEKSHYIHYLTEIRLFEFQKICKYFEISETEIGIAIKNTLIAALEKTKEKVKNS